MATSAFRRKFRLQGKELAYLQTKGVPTIMEHARDFIAKRVASASPENDGKQSAGCTIKYDKGDGAWK